MFAAVRIRVSRFPFPARDDAAPPTPPTLNTLTYPLRCRFFDSDTTTDFSFLDLRVVVCDVSDAFCLISYPSVPRFVQVREGCLRVPLSCKLAPKREGETAFPGVIKASMSASPYATLTSRDLTPGGGGNTSVLASWAIVSGGLNVDIRSRDDVAVYSLRYKSSVLSGGPPE